MYNGFINVLKPSGMTSHDVVGKIRYLTKAKRVGHTGTLDPNAAGVLPICIGAATKFSDYVMEKDKTYIGEIFLGAETTTLDSYGEIVENTPVPEITEKLVIQVLDKFKGEGSQIPPKYSAIKINGEKLYDLARKGKEIPDIKPRKIVIHHIELLEFKSPRILIKVSCSSGTYIRTLALDIARAIGDVLNINLLGYLSLLIRTEAGPMKIEDSITIENLEQLIKNEELKTVDVDKMLEKFSSIEIKDTAVISYTNGARVSEKAIDNCALLTGLLRVYSKDKFLGVGEAVINDGQWLLKAKTQYQIL